MADVSLNDWKISHKLAAGFALMVLVIAGTGAATFYNMGRLTAARGEYATSQDAITLATQAGFLLARQENSYRGYLIGLDPYYLERAAAHRANFGKTLDKLEALLATNTEMVAKIEAGRLAADAWYVQVVEGGSALAANPLTYQDATDMIGADGLADSLMGAAEEPIDEITQYEAEAVEASGARLTEINNHTTIVISAALAFSALAAVFLGWMLSRAIGSPIAAMTGAMRRLAEGDSSVEVPARGRKDEVGLMAEAVQVFKDAAIEKARLENQTDEQRRATEAERARNEADRAAAAEEQAKVVAGLASGLDHLARGDLTFRINEPFPTDYLKLRDDFNAAIGQLQEAMSVVAVNVRAMRSGAGEISQAADDLSRRTEQQAASLEETAAALDEITATVRKSAEGAKQASTVVATSRGDAEKTGLVVGDAVDAMSEIEKSSEQITQIIGVIDEIAFQTNLLALNAGVEAARAGDAGRGFAVVASEVRALAQRSADAAKEIKALISASSQQVAQGVGLVGQTGEALKRIVSQVTEIDSLVSEIAASAQEQATGLHQVNTAVNEMDRVTQQNAAMVEETTAASHSLATEAESLSQSVGRFNIGATGEPVRTQPAPRPAPKASRGEHFANRHTPQMKTTSREGSAARKPEPAAESEGWEEF
ncbi:methyl-accepting chemotaxis protein [Phenylobacterium sp.]|uniref:methyl-accepting chemotaxis protein n=1 Tax=Phenylobacterium sp. TaxID=1871053 RepID=UPI0027300226|nr:methyl-accepting chemotaxis protein [Phenylobacterium sp.]MDP1618239.1 methyl-accepting chemotaxis protein [Phenylobacterium sp.]MDP1986699.1 methyl-accepting chemotaxis protein [Phenylobacterium sp.]